MRCAVLLVVLASGCDPLVDATPLHIGARVR
jgi:hypothetical protein